MQLRNTDMAWSSVNIFLHWLVVLLVLAGATLGLVMDEMPNSMAKLRVFALHKSLGITILGLMLLRLVWRLLAGRPAPLPMARWQAFSAAVTHWLLYAALLAMPLSGWLYNSASNFPLQWFGLFNLPALVERNRDIREWAHDVHETLFLVIVGLVAMHAAAALFHHLILRDATLVRMLPRFLRGRHGCDGAGPGAS